MILVCHASPEIKLLLKDAFGDEIVVFVREHSLVKPANCPSLNDCKAMILEADNFSNSQLELACIKALRAAKPSLPTYLLLKKPDAELILWAFRNGVRDCLLPPYDLAGIASALGESAPLRGRIVGTSAAIQNVKALTERIAGFESSVLITGETGTGKELIAESVHCGSPRRNGPFVCVNCAAIPEPLFESELFGWEKGAFTGAVTSNAGKLSSANGGVLFLDEVGDMALQSQAKFLRVLENREVYPIGGRQRQKIDVRVVAATNHDLKQRAKDGHFRADLLFRLNVIQIHVPPLRERKADVPDLSNHFLREFNRTWGNRIDSFSEESLDLLQQYEWPGNVRELRNVVEAAYVNSGSRTIFPADLPSHLVDADQRVSVNEKQRLAEALFQTNWNVTKAAEKLHWSRMTIYRKLALYNLHRRQEPYQASGRM